MNYENYKIEYGLNANSATVDTDITILLEALNEAYAGCEYLPKGEFDILLSEIEKLRSLGDKIQLFEALKEIFSKVSDSHLKTWQTIEDRSKKRKEKLYEIGTNIAAEEKVVVQFKDGNLLIGFDSFPMPNDPVWENFIESIKEHLYKSDLKSIIIDLRGNDGGNDHYGYELASLIYGGVFNHPISSQAVLQTPLSQLIQSNTFYKRNDEYFEAIRSKFEFALTKEGVEKFRSFSGESSKTEITNDCCDKPLYILIDNETMSSGESTALCFEDYPKVKYVGQPTKGCIEFGNVGLLVLPYSKICIQLSTHKNIFRDGRVFEKVGIQPDQYVQAGEDALSLILV
jgi:hypothetical protein